MGEIPGVGPGLILSIMPETGFDLKKNFKTAKHYASWLGFAPVNKISEGKILSSRTPKKKSTLKKAFKDAANAAGNSNTPIGEFFRKKAYHKSRNVAITATARKIAVSIYVMLDKKVAYQYGHSEKMQEKLKNNQIKNLKKKINKLNLSEKELLGLLNTA